MKLLITLLFTALILSSCNLVDKNKSEKNSPIQLSNLDNTNVFNALFKPDVKEWCTWKPTQADTAFPVSYDGYCYTRVDTIIYYKLDTKNKALLLFGTYDMEDGEPSSCHACAPLISIAIFNKDANENKWTLEKFERDFGIHGSYGQISSFDMTELGNNKFLRDNWYYSNMGYTEEGSTYYCLPSLIQSIFISSDDESASDKPESEQENSTENLKDISSGNQTKVLITKTGQKIEEGRGMVQFNETIEYVLNDSCIFRPVKK